MNTNWEHPLATDTWDSEESRAIRRVIASNHFTMGEEVLNFEREFAEFMGSSHAVMVNSGSSANLCAAFAFRYKQQLEGVYPSSIKNEVIVPAVGWSTTFAPFSQAGFTLVFADIEPDTLNINVDQVKGLVTENTAGIVSVNLLGNPSDLETLTRLSMEHNLFLFEDNCEGLGAEISNKLTGTFGDASSFSFFYSHHMSTMEGGMILTDNSDLFEIMKSVRAHGWTRELSSDSFLRPSEHDDFRKHFDFVLPGFNIRPIEIEAAVGREQLKKLPRMLDQRRRNGKKYTEMLALQDQFSGQTEFGRSSWFSFYISEKAPGRRSALVDKFTQAGIETRPVMTGNFLRHRASNFMKINAPLELTNADWVHDNGLLFGNRSEDLFQVLEQVGSRVLDTR